VTSNAQGSSTIQIDATTHASSRRRFMPYGEIRGTQPAGWSGTKTFVGGTADSSGLIHLGAREYDATAGRFISVDPILDPSDPQQWSAYTYANANPTTFADPTGEIYSDFLEDDLCGDGSTFSCLANDRYASTPSVGPYTPPGVLDQIAAALVCTATVICRIAQTVYTGIHAYDVCTTSPASFECLEASIDVAIMGKSGALRGLTDRYDGPARTGTRTRSTPSSGNHGGDVTPDELDLIKTPKPKTTPSAGPGKTSTVCPLHSFDAATQVLMADGTTKPIRGRRSITWSV
jgi:RHS repeat-associated protein